MFSAVNGCPFSHSVRAAFFAAGEIPRRTFTVCVTGSRCFGRMQAWFRHLWSSRAPRAGNRPVSIR